MNVETIFGPLFDILPPTAARIVVGAIILITGWAVASFLRYLARRFFRRGNVRLRRFFRPEEPDAIEPADEDTSVAVAGGIIFWVVFALFVLLAMNVLGLAIATEWLEGFSAYLPRVLAAAGMILIGVLVGRFVRISLETAGGTLGLHRSEVLGRTLQTLIVLLSVVVAVDQLGIEITLLVIILAIALAAVLGSAALSFGLGARTAVANLISCHYLSKWYRVGQTIRIGEHEGRIAQILPSAVVLQTSAGRVYVPASLFSERESLLLDEDVSR